MADSGDLEALCRSSPSQSSSSSSSLSPLYDGFSSSSPRLIFGQSHLLGNNFLQVMHDLLAFESRIKPGFTTMNAVYRWTCGKPKCDFRCKVPHLVLIIRVRGLPDDKIGIIHQSSTDSPLENILPRAPKQRYCSKTWKNARWHVIKRMLVCLFLYYMCGDIQRIRRHVAKPLHVYMLGGLMSKVLDMQERVSLGNTREHVLMLQNSLGKEEQRACDDELDALLQKDFMATI